MTQKLCAWHTWRSPLSGHSHSVFAENKLLLLQTLLLLVVVVLLVKRRIVAGREEASSCHDRRPYLPHSTQPNHRFLPKPAFTETDSTLPRLYYWLTIYEACNSSLVKHAVVHASSQCSSLCLLLMLPACLGTIREGRLADLAHWLCAFCPIRRRRRR